MAFPGRITRGSEVWLIVWVGVCILVHFQVMTSPDTTSNIPVGFPGIILHGQQNSRTSYFQGNPTLPHNSAQVWVRFGTSQRAWRHFPAVCLGSTAQRATPYMGEV